MGITTSSIFVGGKKAEIKQYLETHEKVNHLLVKITERRFPQYFPYNDSKSHVL